MMHGAPRANLPDGTVEFGVQFNDDPATIITAPSREEAETSLAFNLRDSRSTNKAIAACFATPVLVTRVGDGPWVPAEPTTGGRAVSAVGVPGVAPCRCWAGRALPHDGHCCIRDVGEDDTEVRCGHQQEGMRQYRAARGLTEPGSAEPVHLDPQAVGGAA